MAKVSVILTTFNCQDSIENTINSIVTQRGNSDEFDIELIIVDDCSTDNTTSILNRLNIPFHSTHHNTGGPNTGRNIGLKLATGDYICIADNDDVWHSNKIITQLPYLEIAPIVTSGYTLVDKMSNTTHIRYNKCYGSFRLFYKNITFLNLLKRNLKSQYTYLGSIIYSSSLKNIQFENVYGMVDYDWLLNLFYQNSSIEVCRSLYTRIVSNNNLSLDENYRQTNLIHSINTINNYRDQYPKEVKLGFQRLHGSMARYYYMMNKMTKARYYFRRARPDWKTIAYFITSYFGSRFVNKHFPVFK